MKEKKKNYNVKLYFKSLLNRLKLIRGFFEIYVCIIVSISCMPHMLCVD
jgi:hypothetical protein